MGLRFVVRVRVSVRVRVRVRDWGRIGLIVRLV